MFVKTSEEMLKAIKELDAFLTKAMVDLARATALEAGTASVPDTTTALQGMVATAEHHLVGARLAKKRYEGLAQLRG